MKKKYFIFLLIYTTISCNNSQSFKQENHDLLIEEITNEVINDGIIIFSKSNKNGEIGYLTIYELQKTYMNDIRYKTNDNKKFVSDVLNLKMSFDCGDIIKCFSINDTIKDFYEKNNLSHFVSNYCTTVKNKEYRINNNLSCDAQLSVIYYLYKNNYYTYFDDLIGFYYSHMGNVSD